MDANLAFNDAVPDLLDIWELDGKSSLSINLVLFLFWPFGLHC